MRIGRLGLSGVSSAAGIVVILAVAPNGVEVGAPEGKAEANEQDTRLNSWRALQERSVIKGAVQRESLWEDPKNIRVCWEDAGGAHSVEKAWVKDAVSQTWENTKSVRFVGWGPCAGDRTAIHIKFGDEVPYTKRLGNKLAGVRNGMILTASFGNWGGECVSNATRREECIRWYAVHEFGHALAFAHEHNRFDKSKECKERVQGEIGDWNVTIYDPNSVMNYCSPTFLRSAQLSPLDIETVKRIYG